METAERHTTERDRPAVPSGRWRRSRSAVGAWWQGLGLWQEAALLAGVCLAVLLLVSAFVAQPFVIPSGSMENTLRVGDRVVVNKLAYRFGDQPRRGDVIVFDGAGSFVRQGAAGSASGNPVVGALRGIGGLLDLTQPSQTDFVKRVIGVGGDRVTCCDRQGRILVNGRPVDEPYLYPGDAPSLVRFDIVVPPGTLWVMGDHRSVSSDSRDHLGDPGGGVVPVNKVIGRADWIVWPFDRARSLDSTTAFDSVPAPRHFTAGSGGSRRAVRTGGAHA